jgi:CBS domain containing-hemolysin-like protein
MAHNDLKTANLGPEYDKSLHEALDAVLLSLNATSIEKEWALGGSQEIVSFQVNIEGRPLIVESETYIGLTITGEETLVDTVSGLVMKRLGRTNGREFM